MSHRFQDVKPQKQLRFPCYLQRLPLIRPFLKPAPYTDFHRVCRVPIENGKSLLTRLSDLKTDEITSQVRDSNATSLEWIWDTQPSLRWSIVPQADKSEFIMHLPEDCHENFIKKPSKTPSHLQLDLVFRFSTHVICPL